MMSDDEMQAEDEVRQIKSLIDTWHLMQMGNQIDDELEWKKLNDSIMKFA